jgi:hypothetical protein
MRNLIVNANWEKIKKGGVPQFFYSFGPIKFTQIKLEDCRTRGVTMMKNSTATDGYEYFIDVQGKKALMFGLTIKADDISKMFYVIEYFDLGKKPLCSSSKDISNSVNDEFTDIFVKAEIPEKTGFVKVRWDLCGKVTECVYCNPRLFVE